MAGPHQPERAATTDLPNQINNVCMYVCMFGSASDGLGALQKSGMCRRPRTPTVNKRPRSLNLCFKFEEH